MKFLFNMFKSTPDPENGGLKNFFSRKSKQNKNTCIDYSDLLEQIDQMFEDKMNDHRSDMKRFEERLIERDEKTSKSTDMMDEKRLEFEGYINNSMREVADTLVDVMDKMEYSTNNTNYKKPGFFH